VTIASKTALGSSFHFGRIEVKGDVSLMGSIVIVVFIYLSSTVTLTWHK
jgi:hypothetical protein